ncbi:MAG: glycosyltransferase [Bacteroidota bacterium]
MPVLTIAFIQLIIFAVFILALVAQICYYLIYYRQLAYYKTKDFSGETPPASIIICARNEEDNLVEYLPSIFEQNYPEFEVVVVNDCSFDNTADILKEMAKKHANLKIVTINESKNHAHGKKVALMLGIKGAKYEHLLLTDADCKPNSKDWIKNMVKHFSSETEIVLGYSAFEKQSGFLNKLIRFDIFLSSLQFLSFAIVGKTYKGTGRNLAYKKSLFFKMKGFASHYHIEAGDDDLFVNEAATKHNSKIEVSVNSQTISRVKRTFKDWLLQKRRHSSTFKHYNGKSKFSITMIRLSQYLFFTGFTALLILQFEPIIILSLFMLRFSIQILIFNKSMSLLSEKDLFFLFPIMEIVLLMIYPVIMISNIFTGKNKWKTTNG